MQYKELAPEQPLYSRVVFLLKAKEEWGGPQSIEDFCRTLRAPNTNVRSAVIRLLKKGSIERIGHGIYRIPGDSRTYNENKPHYVHK